MNNNTFICVGVAAVFGVTALWLLKKSDKRKEEYTEEFTEEFKGGGGRGGGRGGGGGGRGGGRGDGRGGGGRGWHGRGGGWGGRGWWGGWGGRWARPLDYWYSPSAVVGSIYNVCVCDDYYYDNIAAGIPMERALFNLKECRRLYGC